MIANDRRHPVPVNATPTSRPLIIPIFILHMGCPHQCVFCNQRIITGETTLRSPVETLRHDVKHFLSFSRRRPSTIQISFFGGSFLGLDQTTIQSLLDTARAFVEAGQADGIRFSTRPDTIDSQRLDLLEGSDVSTVELGVQSMNDQVLDVAGRGHRASHTVDAVTLLKARGYQVGLQMMVGLPGDDDAGAMQTAHRLIALQPDFVRIYPTLVLKGSLLAEQFASARYQPMPLSTCVTLVKRLYLLFQAHHIPVVRMGLQASDGLTRGTDLIAGPYHPAFGHLVLGEIVRDAISAALKAMERRSDPLTLIVHPNMVSRVQGLNKRNILHLKRAFGLKNMVLLQDESVERNQLVVGGQRITLP